MWLIARLVRHRDRRADGRGNHPLFESRRRQPDRTGAGEHLYQNGGKLTIHINLDKASLFDAESENVITDA